MYTRVPSGRMPRGMRVPENYAGNAFRPLPHEPQERRAPTASPPPPRDDAPPSNRMPEDKIQQEAPLSDPPIKTEPPSEPVAAKPSPLAHKLPFRLPSLGTGLSIGFEELLLLGIILLVSQEGKNDELILLLILLLFIQ